MLNRNFAIALAAAMVMAALYGCSSSNGGIKNDRDMYKERLEALDADGDGVADTTAALDADGDGVADTTAALDADGDGVADTTAALDADGDGVADTTAALDADGNGIADSTEALDADGDGIADSTEALDADGNGIADSTEALDADGNGIADSTEALDADGDGVADADPLGENESPMERGLAKAIEPGAMEPMRTVTVDAYEDSFTAEATDLDAMSEGHRITGWAKTALGDDTNTVVLYSNVEAPGDEEYLMYYVSGMVGEGTAGVAGNPGRESVSSVTADGVLTFEDMVASGDGSLFDARRFPSGDQQFFEFENDDATTDVDESMPSFSGMFHGVPGKYDCTGTCTAKADEDGMLSELGGTWTFTPTELDTEDDPYMVYNVTPDEEYVAYGFWKEVDTDGNPTAVTAIWQGGDQVNQDDMGDILGGDVSYSGNAAGKYLRKTLTSNGLVSTLAGGQFTAKVELTAHFGGPDVAENKKFEVDGTVNNFMDGANEIDSQWAVKLDTASITNTGGMGDMSTFMGPAKAMGELAGVDGNWNGAFFGAIIDDPDTVDDPDTTDVDEAIDESTYAPNFAAGQFDGHFLNGHVRGAFGAEKQD